MNKMIIAILVLSFLSGKALASQKAAGDEAVENLRRYIAIDTTNPPGGEMAAAKFLKSICDAESIENEIADIGNGRANFIATLKGDGSRKKIILLHHMDVVCADPKYWSHKPFSGDLAGGSVYGRGAMDIKGKGMIDLMTLVNLRRMKVPLKRDVVLLAVSDEEENSAGTKWIIRNRPELLKDAECLVDEGAAIEKTEDGRVMAYFVSTAEKSPLWLTLKFFGKPGHGSIPIPDSSVNRAIRAAGKIISRPPQYSVLPDFVGSIGAYLGGRDVSKLPGFEKDLAASLVNPEFLAAISEDPEINACLCNTISVTGMKGSDKTNVIPNEASITLDCRLLPGVDRDAFIGELKKLVADDSMEVVIQEYSKSFKSSFDTDFTKALKKCAAKFDPGAPVVQTVVTSSTDGSFYREAGVTVYGFEPYRVTGDEIDLAHGNDERISAENVRFGVELMTAVVSEMDR